MKKPEFNPRNETGKRLLVEWTIQQWQEMQTPDEHDLARDYSSIDFPASAIPARARLDLAVAWRDEKTFDQLMHDPEARAETFRRLQRPSRRGVGRPEGSQSPEASASKEMKSWAFKVEMEVLRIWENSFPRQKRDEKPFALDVAVRIINSMGNYRLNADELRDYRSNRGTRGLPSD